MAGIQMEAKELLRSLEVNGPKLATFKQLMPEVKGLMKTYDTILSPFFMDPPNLLFVKANSIFARFMDINLQYHKWHMQALDAIEGYAKLEDVMRRFVDFEVTKEDGQGHPFKKGMNEDIMMQQIKADRLPNINEFNVSQIETEWTNQNFIPRINACITELQAVVAEHFPKYLVQQSTAGFW